MPSRLPGPQRLGSTCLAALLTLLLSSGVGQANLLSNAGFEAQPACPPGVRAGNNVNATIAPWVIASGPDANVVCVDGPGYTQFPPGVHGPESDASSAAPGQWRHYLDIVRGSNTVYQTFVPDCSGTIVFGGFFSTRGNRRGEGKVSIVRGATPNGVVVETMTTQIPPGNSLTDPWTQAVHSASVTEGMTYSFVVWMDNDTNFDEAFVRFREPCLPVDPCCPPWTEERLAAMMAYSGPGGANPYTLKFQPTAALDQQMQEYVDYLDSLNIGASSISIEFRLLDSSSNLLGGSPHVVTWNAGGVSPTPSFFPSGVMQASQTYRLRTVISLPSGVTFFPRSCIRNDVCVRLVSKRKGGLSDRRPFLRITDCGDRVLAKRPVPWKIHPQTRRRR